ncbi:DUF2894 domain-containing protein [Luteibacter sp.]|uniref:DUF2894 domain-containing protein n=1 Tax=Luteibacter sp. TaxID=1886636 RepID=UPI003F7F7367
MDRKPASPLGDLLGHLSGQQSPTVDLDAELARVRKLWDSVRARSQLQQAELHMPEMESTGPLNSAALVHRAMELMRELSPGYLQHFLSYVDDLTWMERLTVAAAPAAKEAPRPATIGTKKPKARAKPKKKAE